MWPYAGEDACFHIKPNTGHPNSQAPFKKRKKKSLSGPGISGLQSDQHQPQERSVTKTDNLGSVTCIHQHSLSYIHATEEESKMGSLKVELELEGQL